MMKLSTKLLRWGLPLSFPPSLLKKAFCSKLTSQLPDSSHLACRHLITSCVTFSQETLVPEKVISVKETDSTLISSVIDNLEVYGFTKDDITTLFERRPMLINSTVNSWPELVKCLYTLSFEKEEVVRILEAWPEILRCNKSLLEKNFTAWANSGFGDELLFTVLTTHPMFLLLDNHLVLKRIKQYQSYFESKKRVGKLLLLAPNVLEESWKSVCAKLNYLDDLCTDKSDIVSAGVLRHSLFHVKARHEFLVRAGLYKMPKKDFNKKLSKNPSLDSIVNTTDKVFVSNIARLSLFEYEVFLDLFQQELKDSDYEDDPDSDDETDYRHNYNMQYKKGYKK